MKNNLDESKLINSITSVQFFQSWVETVNLRKTELLRIWREPTVFTKEILTNENSVLSEIASNLNLLCYPFDYYSIDAILYKKEDRTHENKGYWFRNIRVAFEHENNFKSGLFQEVAHLLITNCDLKVLVSYPNSLVEQQNELNLLHKIIQGNRLSKIISEEESFLIILGTEDAFKWEGFIYKCNGWKKLKCR